MEDLCFLCKKALSDMGDNAELRRTTTSHTQTNLLAFIQDISSIKLEEDTEPCVCPDCLGLIEDLDRARKQCSELQKRLLGYIELAERDRAKVRIKREKRVEVHCEYTITPRPKLRLHVKKNHAGLTANGDGTGRPPVFGQEATENEEAGGLRQIYNSNQLGTTSITDANHASFNSNLENEDGKNDSVPQDVQFLSVSGEETKKENINTARKMFDGKRREPTEKTFKCDLCGKLWRSRGDLRIHKLTHDGTRPFICEMCGQAYKHKSALDVHVGMHNGVNPFTCVYCNKAFTQKGALQRHMPIHTGECPYQCELCGKRFLYHTSFNVHMASHTGHKAYKCKLCGLALMSTSHLKRHMRAHTGEKNFGCLTCGKRFTERYNLVSHQKLHENPPKVKPGKFSCPVCGLHFEKRHKLTEHLRNTTKPHHSLKYDNFGIELGFAHYGENYEQLNCWNGIEQTIQV